MNRSVTGRRVSALEGKTASGVSGLVQVPKEWSEARRQSEVAALRVREDISAEVPIELLESDSSTELNVVFIGCWKEHLDYISKHGSRVGNPVRACFSAH
jgi:hypothetical protein